jgi:hypothetical protein
MKAMALSIVFASMVMTLSYTVRAGTESASPRTEPLESRS